MRSFAVIGLSMFGKNLARLLYKRGHEVIVIDQDRELVQDAQSFSSQAIVADATDRESMEVIGLEEVDAAVVALGEPIDASILATLYLKELGIQEILVKAASPDHEKILLRLGASEVIFPERDMATRAAARLADPDILDRFTVSAGFSVVQLKTPAKLWGKTLMEAEVRRKYGVSVIGIVQSDGTLKVAPSADEMIEEGEIFWIVGSDEAVRKLRSEK